MEEETIACKACVDVCDRKDRKQIYKKEQEWHTSRILTDYHIIRHWSEKLFGFT